MYKSFTINKYTLHLMCEDPDEIAKRPPKRSAPRIACILGETPQYFLIVEEKVLFSVAKSL